MMKKYLTLMLLLIALTVFAGCIQEQKELKKVQSAATVENKTIEIKTDVAPVDQPPHEEKPESLPSASKDKFIVANPLDLSQINSMSKFRSCVGHDYSGTNVEDEKETLRSMKHYIEPISSLLRSKNTVKAIAPFNGKITSIESEEYPVGKQVAISADTADGWTFIFFHINPVADLKEGDTVKAGQLIGYAELGDTGRNFDFALKKFDFLSYSPRPSDEGKSQKIDSPFMHMSDSVLNQYSSHGVTLDNIIITKETRDANPCPVKNTVNSEALFSSENYQDYFVTLQVGQQNYTTENYEHRTATLNANNNVFFESNGIVFEHYWPNSRLQNLKGDESEMLVYNNANSQVEIVSTDMRFIINDKEHGQYSGTWEKFPLATSWDRIEYINIHPSSYTGEPPLILQRRQKGKIHYHYQFEKPLTANDKQEVQIYLTFKIAGKAETINKKLERKADVNDYYNDVADHEGEPRQEEGGH